jgi:hypothetical protein
VIAALGDIDVSALTIGQVQPVAEFAYGNRDASAPVHTIHIVLVLEGYL